MRYVSMNIPLDQAQATLDHHPWRKPDPKVVHQHPRQRKCPKGSQQFSSDHFFIENKHFSAETRSPGNGTGRLIGFVGPPKTANTQSIVSVRVKRRSAAETKKKQVLNFWIDFSFVSIFRCMTNSISKLSGLEKKSSNLTSSFFLPFKLKKRQLRTKIVELKFLVVSCSLLWNRFEDRLLWVWLSKFDL